MTRELDREDGVLIDGDGADYELRAHPVRMFPADARPYCYAFYAWTRHAGAELAWSYAPANKHAVSIETLTKISDHLAGR